MEIDLADTYELVLIYLTILFVSKSPFGLFGKKI